MELYEMRKELTPPGYIFFSNFGISMNGEKWDEKSLKDYLSNKYPQIKVEDILVLKNLVPESPYSVFLPESYLPFVNEFNALLSSMMDYLNILKRMGY